MPSSVKTVSVTIAPPSCPAIVSVAMVVSGMSAFRTMWRPTIRSSETPFARAVRM
jgi:hypothetical protein